MGGKGARTPRCVHVERPWANISPRGTHELFALSARGVRLPEPFKNEYDFAGHWVRTAVRCAGVCVCKKSVAFV